MHDLKSASSSGTIQSGRVITLFFDNDPVRNLHC